MRRFEINPGPLRVRGEIPTPDHNAGRCVATTRIGLRCQWEGKTEVDGRWLCGTHARAATRRSTEATP